MIYSNKKSKKSNFKTYIKAQKSSKLTLEIIEGLKEVKLMLEGKLKPLSLKDI
jgi:hypothetical protein